MRRIHDPSFPPPTILLATSARPHRTSPSRPTVVLGRRTVLLVLVAVLAAGFTLPTAAQGDPLPRPVGPDLRVTEPLQTYGAVLAMQPDGGQVVVWPDLDDGGVWLRRVLPDGTAAPAVRVGDGEGPGVAADAVGRFVVLWRRVAAPEEESELWTLMGRRYGPDGTPLGPVFQVSDVPGAPFSPWPSLTMRPDGSFAVAWNDLGPPPDYEEVRVRRFHPDGTPRGASVQANQRQWMEQYVTDLAYTPDGELLVTWSSWGGEGLFTDVFVRRLDAEGRPVGDELWVNPDDFTVGARQDDLAVAALDDGRAVLVWSNVGADEEPEGGFSSGIQGRLMAPGGDLGEVFRVNHVLAGEQVRPRVVALGGDRFLVAWGDDCPGPPCSPEEPEGSPRGVFGRIFEAAPEGLTASPLTGDLRLTDATVGDQLLAALAADGEGSAAVAWAAANPDDLRERSLFVRRLVAPCTPAAGRLCLGAPAAGVEEGGRFRVRVSWRDFQGGSGTGTAVHRDGVAGDWGTFWFFRPANVELAVKVLDGSRINGYHWVFFASLSNVAFDLQVLDTATGLSRTYHNPSGTFASRGDTRALPAPPVEGGGGAASPAAIRTAAGPEGGGVPRLPVQPLASAAAAEEEAGPCVPTDHRVCLQGGRFAVEIPTLRNATGAAGPAGAEILTSDTAYFWFFRRENPEVLVKVLDGRPVNGHFWVFFGGLTNVGFDLVVRDTVTGEEAVYTNPPGGFPSRGDTTALPLGTAAGDPPDAGGLEAAERLLFVGAHPDDEILAAALLGELCATVSRCTLLVATRGEGGTCHDPAACGDDLGTVRSTEMAAAAGVLNADLVQWDLPDVLPADPAAVRQAWAGAAGGEEALRLELESVLGRVSPSAVLTFDPAHGSTGHPAHRALGELVREVVAERAAMAPEEAPELWMLETLVERSPEGTYRFRPAAGAAVTVDGSQPSAVAQGSLWHHLLRVAQAHASQFPADRLAALAAVPADQRRVDLALALP